MPFTWDAEESTRAECKGTLAQDEATGWSWPLISQNWGVKSVDSDLGNSRPIFSFQISTPWRKTDPKTIFAEFVKDRVLSQISLLYGIQITEIKGTCIMH